MNPDLIRDRMMRGALMGPAEPEKAPPKYCQGKLDNGRPCRIVVLHGDYCIRHQKEIDALEAGAPLRPGRIERAKETEPMAKYRCNKTGCDRAVKNAGDFCWQHKDLADQVEAGVVKTDTTPPDEEANAAADDHAADAGKLIDVEISPVAPHPPQEHADPLVLPSSPATEGTKGLAALLRAPAPLPVGLFIPFASDELAALEESEVTPEVIREFVIMGLEGKLQPVPA